MTVLHGLVSTKHTVAIAEVRYRQRTTELMPLAGRQLLYATKAVIKNRQHRGSSQKLGPNEGASPWKHNLSSLPADSLRGSRGKRSSSLVLQASGPGSGATVASKRALVQSKVSFDSCALAVCTEASSEQPVCRRSYMQAHSLHTGRQMFEQESDYSIVLKSLVKDTKQGNNSR